MARRRSGRAILWMVAVLCAPLVGTADAEEGEGQQMEWDTQQMPFFEVRGGLENCRIRFERDKEGRVAYLGGSITTMKGWRELTYDMLEAWFPDTTFDFINAGIGGTNSTLGAFRFKEDVFKNGKVDLLFLEYAVNDSGDPSADNRRKRAMEGIVRQARRLNPEIDILIQYFADTRKVETVRAGEVPDVILDHEEVARHYNIPVLNLAAEVTRRLDQGEFTWEQFSRDTCHPLPFGHQLYADCIGAFLDELWKAPAPEDGAPVAYPLPEPLDPANYERGRFVVLDEARLIDGWTRMPAWTAEKTCNYSGPVDVLVAESPGAVLELAFGGTLVGINAIAGMDAGTLECTIDDGSAQTIDLFDHYCERFHRPVCHILAEDLPPGRHTLTLRMADTANPKSLGHAARILRFCAN